MKRLGTIVGLLAFAATLGFAPRAGAQAVTQYAKVVTVSTVATTSFGLSAQQVTIANDGAQDIYVTFTGTASSSDTSSVSLKACETGTWSFRPDATKSTVSMATASSTATARVAAFAISNPTLQTVGAAPAAPLFSRSNHCTGAINETVTGALSVTGVVTNGAGTQGNNTVKALTESSATNFALVSIASGSYVAAVIPYSIEASDATDFQARSGVLVVNAVNKAGTVTCSVATVTSAVEVAAVSSGTLTNTFTCADSTTNGVLVKANAVSSLTQTTLQIRYRVDVTGTATVTAQ